MKSTLFMSVDNISICSCCFLWNIAACAGLWACAAFWCAVEDGKSFDVVGDGFLAGEASKSDGYFGWITVRKWSEYC